MRPTSSTTRWFLLALTLLALATRLAFFLAFDNVFSQEGESYSKINLVQAWEAQGKAYPDPNFGPLHTWLIYLLHVLFGGWVAPVRALALILATLTIPLFYYYVREAFDARIATVAALLYAVFPGHLRASVTGLAEVPFLFFFVGGLVAFYRGANVRQRGRWAYLTLAAAGMTGAGMLRYEAWLYLPVLCLALLAWRRTAAAFVFGALCAVFPLIHMYLTYKVMGHPTGFAQTSALSFLQYMPDLPFRDKAWGWFRSLGITMGPPAAVLVPLGLILAVVRRKHLLSAALFAFPYAIQQYKALTNTMDPSLERYTLSMGTLLFPYVAWLLLVGADRLARWRPRARHAVWTAVVPLMAFQVAWGWQGAIANQYDTDIQAVVAWLRANAGPHDRVLPDQRYHPYVQLESGVPYANFVSLEWTPDRKALNREAFAQLLATTPPDLVIFDYLIEGNEAINSNLDVFPMPRGKRSADFEGLHFEKAFADGWFVIYRVTRAEAAP